MNTKNDRDTKPCMFTYEVFVDTHLGMIKAGSFETTEWSDQGMLRALNATFSDDGTRLDVDVDDPDSYRLDSHGVYRVLSVPVSDVPWSDWVTVCLILDTTHDKREATYAPGTNLLTEMR